MRVPTRLPPIWATLPLAAGLAWLAWPLTGRDVADYLIPWFKHIRAAGLPRAFAMPFGDYTPPYLYLLATTTLLAGLASAVTLIKLLSVACAMALALACRALLKAAGAEQPGRGAALVLLLPTVLVNAAVLGQCDALWSAACLMALAAACRERLRAMLAWFGVALAVKLQAIFLAPFLLALLLRRRVAWRWWALAPAGFAAMMLPAWLAGWPAADLATIYLRQSAEYPRLAFNAPNIWSIVQGLVGETQGVTVVALIAALTAAGTLVAWEMRRSDGTCALIEAALLSTLLLPGLLPRMHERYFFLADILSLALALAKRGRRAWAVAMLVQAGSALALFGYVSGVAGAAVLGAVPMLLATWLLVRDRLGLGAGESVDHPASIPA